VSEEGFLELLKVKTLVQSVLIDSNRHTVALQVDYDEFIVYLVYNSCVS